MTKLSYISDKVLTFFTGLLIGGYFLSTAAERILFAFNLSLCLTEGLRLLSKGKNPPIDKRRSPVKEHLLLSSPTLPLSLLINPLSKIYTSVADKGQYLLVNGDKAIFSCFTIEPLSPDELVRISCLSKEIGVRRISVICSTAVAKSVEIASILGVRLIAYDELFSILKRLNCLPKTEDKPKPTRRIRLRRLFNKKRALPLILCSVTLFTLSRITAFSIYYIVISVACLFLAAFALFLPVKD